MSRSCWARKVKGVSIAVVFPSYAVHCFGAAICVSMSECGWVCGCVGVLERGKKEVSISQESLHFQFSSQAMEMRVKLCNCATE